MADIKMNIGQIKLGSIAQTSGVFVGSNLQAKWSSTKKENDGFGDTTGDHNKAVIDARVHDGDAIDTIRLPRDHYLSYSK